MQVESDQFLNMTCSFKINKVKDSVISGIDTNVKF